MLKRIYAYKSSFRATVIPKILLLILLFHLFISSMAPALAADIIDQSNDVERNGVFDEEPQGQSFTPTKKRLVAVDLALNPGSNVNTYTVPLYILQFWGGPVIGSASAVVPP